MMIDYPQPRQIPELKRLWAAAFPDPDAFIEGFFAAGFSSARCRCITEEGSVAAVLYWFDGSYRGQKLAYLYAIATDPARRGRGFCRMLMEDTHALLQQQGYTAALLLPGEPGLRRMYRKFGYRDCCKLRQFSCTAGDPVNIREITWQEYAALRPLFLPEDGALQDGLAFLSTYARFYHGSDFLLACAQGEGSLLGLELLGNGDAAAGILTALGYNAGTFRTPGPGSETVMALTLKEGAILPGYLGLTFD